MKDKCKELFKKSHFTLLPVVHNDWCGVYAICQKGIQTTPNEFIRTLQHTLNDSSY